MHGTFNSNTSITTLESNSMGEQADTISAMLSPESESGCGDFAGTNVKMSIDLSSATLSELQAMDDLFGVLAETLVAFECQGRATDLTAEISEAMTTSRNHVWRMIEHYECATEGEVYEQALSVIRSFAHCGAGLDEIVAYASRSQIKQTEVRRRRLENFS